MAILNYQGETCMFAHKLPNGCQPSCCHLLPWSFIDSQLCANASAPQWSQNSTKLQPKSQDPHETSWNLWMWIYYQHQLYKTLKLKKRGARAAEHSEFVPSTCHRFCGAGTSLGIKALGRPCMLSRVGIRQVAKIPTWCTMLQHVATCRSNIPMCEYSWSSFFGIIASTGYTGLDGFAWSCQHWEKMQAADCTQFAAQMPCSLLAELRFRQFIFESAGLRANLPCWWFLMMFGRSSHQQRPLHN